MQFEDFSPYRYGISIEIPEIKNIGWIELGHQFSKGLCEDHVLQKMKHMACVRSINQTRGWHICSLCRAEVVVVESGLFERRLGSAEIWVPTHDEFIYAAPNLVIHYIEKHHYLPPDDFRRAVNAFDLDSEWDAEAEFELLFRSHM